jgi:hypothetical protein
MNDNNTVAADVGKPTVRKMTFEELPNKLLSSIQCSRVESWYDPREARDRREQVGWVAEVQGRSAGSVVCAVVRPTATAGETSPLRRVARFLASLLGSRSELPLYVECWML